MKKKGAMEMSMGTIVTIVLLVSVLVMGIFFIQKISKTATNVIDLTDEQLRNEMNKLFSEDTSKKLVVYPATREVSIKKGESGGFGFSIRNTGNAEGSFSYTIDVMEIGQGCQLTQEEAANLIILGKTGTGIQIPSGDVLENPIKIKFTIPDSTPLCNLGYGINVKKDGQTYLPTVSLYLEVKAK